MTNKTTISQSTTNASDENVTILFSTITGNITVKPESLNDTTVTFFFLPQDLSITIICVFALLTVCILFGNILVLLAFYLEKHLRVASNYQIAGLACCDILMGVINPMLHAFNFTTATWYLGETFCKIWNMCNWTLFAISESGCLMISLDRFLSIKFYKTYPIWRTKRKMLISIFVYWAIAIVFHIILIIFWVKFETKPVEPRFQPRCEPILKTTPTMVTGIIYYWIPLLSMCMMYCYILRVVADLNKNATARSKVKTLEIQSPAVRTIMQNNTDVNQSRFQDCGEDKRSPPWMGARHELKVVPRDISVTPPVAPRSVDSYLTLIKSPKFESILEKLRYPRPVNTDMSFDTTENTRHNIEKNETFHFLDGSFNYFRCKIGENPYESANVASDSNCAEHEVLHNRRVSSSWDCGRCDFNNSHTVVSLSKKESPAGRKTTHLAPVTYPPNSPSTKDPAVNVTKPRLKDGLDLAQTFSSLNPEMMDPEARAQKRTRKVYRMVTLVLIAFAIFYGPFWVLVTLSYIFPIYPPWWLYEISSMIGYLNSVISPIVYAAGNPMFMQAFKRILLKCDCSRNNNFKFYNK